MGLPAAGQVLVFDAPLDYVAGSVLHRFLPVLLSFVFLAPVSQARLASFSPET
jgi:hypothetical protein